MWEIIILGLLIAIALIAFVWLKVFVKYIVIGIVIAVVIIGLRKVWIWLTT